MKAIHHFGLVIIYLVTAVPGLAEEVPYREPVWVSTIKVYFMPLASDTFVPMTTEGIIGSINPVSGDPSCINETHIHGLDKFVLDTVGKLRELKRNDQKSGIDVRAVFCFTRSDNFTIYLAMDGRGQFEWANIKADLPDKPSLEILMKMLPAGELESVSLIKAKE